MNKKKLMLLAIGLAILMASAGAVSSYMLFTRNTDKIRVACVGDSITEGTGYPIDLWQLLGPNYMVGNFGVAGATVYLESDTAYMYQTAFQVAKQFEPNIVIIMLGTNDANLNLTESNTTFVNNYVKLIDAFLGLASKPKVWLVEPPPIYNNTADLSSEILIQNVIPNIQLAANQMHLPLIDANTPLVNQPNNFLDGVHPNGNGTKTIANTIYHALISGNNT